MTNSKGLNRICLHWTAGASSPNNEELQYYHFLVDSKGNIHKGYHKPEDNINCKDGNYAAHCALGNTGTIGVAMCGMWKFNTTTRVSCYPLTATEIEATCKLVAQLCKEYNILIDKSHVYTHAEYDSSGRGTHEGKIDIIYIPHEYMYGIDKCGTYLRNKVKWYYNQLQENK